MATGLAEKAKLGYINLRGVVTLNSSFVPLHLLQAFKAQRKAPFKRSKCRWRV